MEWIDAAQWQALAADQTDAHRVATGPRGWLDRYGDWGLWSGDSGPGVELLRAELAARYTFSPRGYLSRELVRKAADQKPARLVAGENPGVIVVRENGLSFYVEPAGGYSSGLFLDQRLNRKWVRELAAKRVLNLFAYTCSFTVCAAVAGAETWSVDAAKRVLNTGRRNLELNGIDPAQGHRFLADDAMKVVPRLGKRGETFDLIVLDPPTFGRSEARVFRIEEDLPFLVRECARLLDPNGWLLVACNYAAWNAHDLKRVCASALTSRQVKFERGMLPPEMPSGAVSWRMQILG